MDKRISDLLISIVKDLEYTREKLMGYSYVRTIRNILIGKEDAIIAPHFRNKSYYGLLKKLTLEETEHMMEELLNNNQISCLYTEHGKLYCSKEYHEGVCKKQK